MSKKLAWSITLLALALCLPAAAQTTFFDDFGAGNNYQSGTGWTVSGTGTVGTSFTAANLFTSLSSGSVTEIDLGVGYVAGTNAFYAAVYTDNGGLPGTQLFRIDNLSSSQNFGGCCGVIDITGINGLTLTAGQQYFVVLGPESLNSTVWEAWNWNSTGAMGIDLYSENGGQTWNSNGEQTIGAFDIIGSNQPTAPEPSSLLLLGTGLVGAFSTLRKKIMR